MGDNKSLIWTPEKLKDLLQENQGINIEVSAKDYLAYLEHANRQHNNPNPNLSKENKTVTEHDIGSNSALSSSPYDIQVAVSKALIEHDRQKQLKRKNFIRRVIRRVLGVILTIILVYFLVVIVVFRTALHNIRDSDNGKNESMSCVYIRDTHQFVGEDCNIPEVRQKVMEALKEYEKNNVKH